MIFNISGDLQCKYTHKKHNLFRELSPEKYVRGKSEYVRNRSSM
jgi:hypothetical protein